MQRIHQKIGRALFGARVVSLLLSGCNGANTPDPTPNPNPAPKPETKPEEGKTILKFRVRALSVNDKELGFRVFKAIQQIEVAVAKGKTTATKTALFEAIKAKDPEMEEIDEFQLYKANKTDADIFSENDEGLKNNANVFIGKDTYTRKLEFTLQSITAEKNGYMPMSRYSSGVKLTTSVGHTADEAAVTQALKDKIEKTVRGDNYDRLYKLFGDAAGAAPAYARDFVDKGTIYIGKKAVKPTITLKAAAAKTTRNADGFIYKGVTISAEKSQITADDDLPDTTLVADLRAMFEKKIRDRLTETPEGGGNAIVSETDYDELVALFSDVKGEKPVTDEIYTKGGIVYVGKKDAKHLEFEILSIEKADLEAVTADTAKRTIPINSSGKTYKPTDDELFTGKAVVSVDAKLYPASGGGVAPNADVVAKQLMAATKKIVKSKFALYKEKTGTEIDDARLTGGGIIFIGIEPTS